MEFDEKLPAYVKFLNTIKIQIFSGEMQPGTQVLPVRNLSIKYEINVNTIQKAMRYLEEEELIITNNTRSRIVTEDKDHISRKKAEFFRDYVDEFLKIGRDIKLSDDQIISLVKESIING